FQMIPEMGCAAGQLAVLSIGVDRLMSVLAPFRYQQTNVRAHLTVHFVIISLFCAFNAFLICHFYRAQQVICQMNSAFHAEGVVVYAVTSSCVNVVAMIVYGVSWRLIKSRAFPAEVEDARKAFRTILLVTIFDIVGWTSTQLIVAILFLVDVQGSVRLCIICLAGIPVHIGISVKMSVYYISRS
ncbi:hypothetical protein PENTCL1PPCAC_3409, partial [Pristionchus entomophagus]